MFDWYDGCIEYVEHGGRRMRPSLRVPSEKHLEDINETTFI